MSSANNLEEPLLPGLASPAPTSEEAPEALRLVPRRLEVLEEKVLPDRQRRSRAAPAPSITQLATPASAPTEDPQSTPTAEPTPLKVTPRDVRVAATFEAIAKVLSIRWLLTLAIACSFALGLLVKDVWSAAAFVIFTSFSITALVLMEKLQRPK